ncbi:MAG: hypothetical protein J6Q60_05755 [Bacteroidaceae bacterium]|nr:hypothetical protein [Bacteroidaceae bacterium]
MKGIIVSDIPVKRKHNLKRFLDEFMLTNAKHFKVEYAEGEYKTKYHGYKSLWLAAKNGKYPIQVSWLKGEVYLIRTDM